MRQYNIAIRLFYKSIILCFVLVSCNRHIQPYRYVPHVDSLDSLTKLDSIKIYTRKSIILTSDTSLSYSILLGGLGISTTINYQTSGTLLTVDSTDINYRDSFQDYTNEIFNHQLIYSKDCLIDLMNGEKYYNPRYIDKHFTTKKSNKFYLIVDGKKKKITSKNASIIISEIDTDKYDWSEVSKSEAKKQFGIKTKYLTYKLIEK